MRRVLIGLVVCALAVLARAMPATPPTFEQFLERTWVAFQMSSGSRPEVYGMGWGVPEGGYDKFYREQLVPLIDRGWRRFLIHQPYGDDRVGRMDFDARLDAQARDFTAPLDFGSMLRRLAREHPDVRVIVYLGAIDVEDLEQLLERGRRLSWLDRVRRSVLDVEDAGNTDLAIDHAAALEADDAAWQACELLFSLLGPGRSGWIEAVPPRSHVHQLGSNVIVTESFWDRSRPPDETLQAGFADSAWAAPSSMLTGRILRWELCIGRGDDFAGSIAGVLAVGHEWGGSLMYYQGTARQLWEEVIARLTPPPPPPAIDADAEVGVLLDAPPGAQVERGTAINAGDVVWGPEIRWTWPAGTVGDARVWAMASAPDRKRPARESEVRSVPVGAP